MIGRTGEPSARSAAKIAGSSYLAIFALAIFANFFVRQGLVERGDAAATARNIVTSIGLFRLGLASFLIVFMLDVVIAWALYVVFLRVSRSVSLLTAWFRLIYTAFLGVASIFFFVVLELLSGPGYLAAFERGQLDAHVSLSLEAFDAAWLIGLACFGIHLVLLGAISLRSGFVPKTLSAILILAGLAYVIDTFAHALLGNYADLQTVFLAMVAVPSVIGELWFGLWLLLKGGKGSELPTTDIRDASLSGAFT
jgi:Domain of unknown function (DUF4386)